MKKLLYIPAAIFALSAAINFVIYLLACFGWIIEENDGTAALAFIHCITGTTAAMIFFYKARN